MAVITQLNMQVAAGDWSPWKVCPLQGEGVAWGEDCSLWGRRDNVKCVVAAK